MRQQLQIVILGFRIQILPVKDRTCTSSYSLNGQFVEKVEFVFQRKMFEIDVGAFVVAPKLGQIDAWGRQRSHLMANTLFYYSCLMPTSACVWCHRCCSNNIKSK